MGTWEETTGGVLAPSHSHLSTLVLAISMLVEGQGGLGQPCPHTMVSQVPQPQGRHSRPRETPKEESSRAGQAAAGPYQEKGQQPGWTAPLRGLGPSRAHPLGQLDAPQPLQGPLKPTPQIPRPRLEGSSQLREEVGDLGTHILPGDRHTLMKA